MVINIVLSVALAFVIGWMAVPIGTAIAAYANAFLLWREIGARGGPNLLVETGGRIIRDDPRQRRDGGGCLHCGPITAPTTQRTPGFDIPLCLVWSPWVC